MNCKIIVILILLTVFASCHSIDHSEEKVLSDIFPQLIDSMHVKWRKPVPPPPPPLFDENMNFIGYDTLRLKREESAYEAHLKYLDSTCKFKVLAVENNVLPIDWSDFSNKIIEDSIFSSIISSNKGKNSLPEIIALNKIISPDGFILVPRHLLDSSYTNIWHTCKMIKFAGVLNFSGIYYSESPNNALLQIDYNYLQHEGYSFYALLSYNGDKWVIRRMFLNWVS